MYKLKIDSLIKVLSIFNLLIIMDKFIYLLYNMSKFLINLSIITLRDYLFIFFITIFINSFPFWLVSNISQIASKTILICLYIFSVHSNPVKYQQC